MLSIPGLLPAKSSRHPTEPIIRVKLGSLHKKIEITFPKSGHIKNSKGRTIRSLSERNLFKWHLPPSKRRRTVQYENQTLTFRGRDNKVKINGKLYRGELKIKFTRNGAIVVNHVGIEDYLRGVVGSEMGSLSPAESLKAQTVIARTYAYSNRGKHGKDGADVCDSTHCQVYKGVSAERETINKAIDSTRGIIMISEGKPIQTLYHATCGGMTSDNDKVFGGAPCSYLRRVICPFCKNGINYRWSKTISEKELKTALAKEKICFNRLYDVEVEAPALMDRVSEVVLLTDKGKLSVKGTTFRRLFNLNSTTFTIGNRKAVKAIISSAKEVESKSALTPETAKAICMIADLGTTASDGPPQLIIQTGEGLRRVTRPENGWKTISCRMETAKPSESAKKTENALNRSMNSQEIKKIEIFGRGFGHQVGLCQSGAIELGKRNWSYRQILPYYYSNVALRKLGY
ncbi:MAG: hypothetical protein Kow0029_17950 [Candidatus Rifleibacteriota bacterium]